MNSENSVKDNSNSPRLKGSIREVGTQSQTEGTTTDEIFLNKNLRSLNSNNLAEENKKNKDLSPKVHNLYILIT